MAKMVQLNPRDPEKISFMFDCPGCGKGHQISTRNPNGPVWQFDGNFENPTVSPSVLVTWERPRGGKEVCHSFIRNGKIEYLSDSTHKLAGQTVDLPEVKM